METGNKEKKIEAKRLFLKSVRIATIARELDIPERTIYEWRKKELWKEQAYGVEPLPAIKARFEWLCEQKHHNKDLMQDLNMCTKVIERLERIELAKTKLKLRAEGSVKKGKSRENKSKKNDFLHIDLESCEDKLLDGLFEYQKILWGNRNERNRDCLKSRQIGLTYYFAKEAFFKMLTTGRSQNFLSASKNQSLVFREYIVQFALDCYEVQLKGKEVIQCKTPKGPAKLRFLATNVATAQSYNGDVYIDEYFWIPKFAKLRDVANGMATHKQFKRTRFSTPSTKAHEGFDDWNGTAWKEANDANKWPDLDQLKAGCKCPDGVWRMFTDIYTAEKMGCDLFDIPQLKLENSEDVFRQLYMCEFIDDAACVFKFEELQDCLTDSTDWKDVDLDNARPYDGEVWVAIDPARYTDGAAVVAIAPPIRKGGKFRMLQGVLLRNALDREIAEYVQKLTQRFNVTYMIIDRTGVGEGTFQRIQEFYMLCDSIFYTNEIKKDLIQKAKRIIRDRRIKWDASYREIALSFMGIEQKVNRNGEIIYTSKRTAKAGHADYAWAIMMLLLHEGLINDTGVTGIQTASVTVY